MYLRRICWRRLPEPAPSRVNPRLHRIGGGHLSVAGHRHRRVGAGLPAKGPALLANLHQTFTVAAATVFAGKPAPTPDRGWTQVGGWAQAVV